MAVPPSHFLNVKVTGSLSNGLLPILTDAGKWGCTALSLALAVSSASTCAGVEPMKSVLSPDEGDISSGGKKMGG